MWDWLQNLSGGAANFIGSLTGAAIGLIALLIGALFNARLARRRDQELRLHERRSTAAALRAELSGLNRTLLQNADMLSDPLGRFRTPDLAHSVRIMPQMIPKLGLLDSDTIRDVVDAYILVEQYCESLIMLGGHIDTSMPSHRRLVMMPKEQAERVATINRNMSQTIERAMARLDPYLL